MFFLYIIKSDKDGSYYTGSCQNIQERLSRHNSGYSKSTKSRTPWHLVYFEEYGTRSEAQTREYQIKRQKSRVYIEALLEERNR